MLSSWLRRTAGIRGFQLNRFGIAEMSGPNLIFCSSNTSQPGMSANSSPNASIMRRKWPQILKSGDDRIAGSLGLKAVCEGGTLLFPPFHPIFFVALEGLADQVLLVKCPGS